MCCHAGVRMHKKGLSRKEEEIESEFLENSTPLKPFLPCRSISLEDEQINYSLGLLI